ncbi:hypothetical protein A3758_07365 [Oleiphilus sp. HI0118]|nr:hypothetical protein A3758_07365 [Oleiphilus sp. HI0118]
MSDLGLIIFGVISLICSAPVFLIKALQLSRRGVAALAGFFRLHRQKSGLELDQTEFAADSLYTKRGVEIGYPS